jgi:hypothetical protein
MQLPESSFSFLNPSGPRMDSELLLGLAAPGLLLLASEFCVEAQQNSKQPGVSITFHYEPFVTSVMPRNVSAQVQHTPKGSP